MNSVPTDIARLLALEEIDIDLFRGEQSHIPLPQVYGGHVLGQALAAAARTVKDMRPHSMHAYFLSTGDTSAPILYKVRTLKDGRSFCVRRVIAIQHAKPIFELTASFHVEEPGDDFYKPMPANIPGPNDLPSDREARLKVIEASTGKSPYEYVKHWLIDYQWPLETRRIGGLYELEKKSGGAEQMMWIRALGSLPSDEMTHAAALAYLSDLEFLTVCLKPHGQTWFDGSIKGASLDHAMWFHRPFHANEWLLYVHDCPNTSGARGLARGLFYNQAGELVASTAQEGLIRALR